MGVFSEDQAEDFDSALGVGFFFVAEGDVEPRGSEEFALGILQDQFLIDRDGVIRFLDLAIERANAHVGGLGEGGLIGEAVDEFEEGLDGDIGFGHRAGFKFAAAGEGIGAGGRGIETFDDG